MQGAYSLTEQANCNTTPEVCGAVVAAPIMTPVSRDNFGPAVTC